MWASIGGEAVAAEEKRSSKYACVQGMLWNPQELLLAQPIRRRAERVLERVLVVPKVLRRCGCRLSLRKRIRVCVGTSRTARDINKFH